MTGTNGSTSGFAGRRIEYYSGPNQMYLWHPALRDGRFNHRDVYAMMADDAVKIGLTAIYGPIKNAKFEVRANSTDIKTFVENTIYRFWHHDLQKVLNHYVPWGTSGCEVMYEKDQDTKLWRYAGMDDFSFYDMQPMRHPRSRHITGVRVSSNASLVGIGQVTINHGGKEWNMLRHPKIFWCAHRPLCGEPFGHSALESSWSSWMEKRGQNGAVSVRRLWGHNNAFRGCIVEFPPGFTDYNGRNVPNQDIAMEIAQNLATGGVVVLPCTTDELGKNLWRITDPKQNGSMSELMEYPSDLNREIWQGMEIPDEVMHAPDVGSMFGRQGPVSGPMIIFLSGIDLRVSELITAFDVGPSGYTTRNEQSGGVIRPLVMENFGKNARYQVIPISLMPKPQEPGAGGTGGDPRNEPPQDGPQPPPQQGALKLSQGDYDEKEHPRGDHGRWVEAMNAIPHGELKHVGGLPVRRQGEKEFRTETDTGHVTGEAEHVAKHIGEDVKKRALHGKKREAALKRSEAKDDTPKSVGHVGFQGPFEYFKNHAGELIRAKKDEAIMPDGRRTGRWEAPTHLADKRIAMLGVKPDTGHVPEPDALTDPQGHLQAAQGFAKLPKGTKVVSLHPDTHGRVGEIVKDETGRNRVKLEGTPGFASEHVEPLEEKHSWRGEKKEGQAEAGKLFDETDDMRQHVQESVKADDPKLQESVYQSMKKIAAMPFDERMEHQTKARAAAKKAKAINQDVIDETAHLLLDQYEAKKVKEGKGKADEERWAKERHVRQGATMKGGDAAQQEYGNAYRTLKAYLENGGTVRHMNNVRKRIEISGKGSFQFDDATGTIRQRQSPRSQKFLTLAPHEVLKMAGPLVSIKPDGTLAKPEPERTPEDTDEFFRPRHGNQPLLFSGAVDDVLDDDLELSAGHDVSGEARDAGGKWTHGQRASELAGKHAELKKAMEEHKQGRLKAFQEVKAKAQEALAKADELGDSPHDLHMNMNFPDEIPQSFSDLESASMDFDKDAHPVDLFEAWKNIERLATAALKEPAPKDEGWTNELTAANTDIFNGIIEDARTARQYLKTYVQHRKEMKAIKEGSPMDVQLSMVEDDEPVSLSSSGDGHWITIGGQIGGDGIRHGGSPVYIENGRITKGHPSLTGKKIGNLAEPAEEGTHRQQLHKSRHYARAVVAKKARQEHGVNSKHLHQLAAEMMAHDKQFANEIGNVIEEAKGMLQARGVQTKDFSRRHEISDHTQIPGFDEVARSLAHLHPEILGNAGYEHQGEGSDQQSAAQEKLFDMLKSGKPAPMSEEDAYSQALDYLVAHKQAQPQAAQSDDPIPFSTATADFLASD